MPLTFTTGDYRRGTLMRLLAQVAAFTAKPKSRITDNAREVDAGAVVAVADRHDGLVAVSSFSGNDFIGLESGIFDDLHFETYEIRAVFAATTSTKPGTIGIFAHFPRYETARRRVAAAS